MWADYGVSVSLGMEYTKGIHYVTLCDIVFICWFYLITSYFSSSFNCRTSWHSIIMRISASTYNRVRRLAKSCVQNVIRPHTETSRGERGISHFANTSENCIVNIHCEVCDSWCWFTGEIAKGYMRWYVSIMGDHHPESERILLPVGIGIADIYREYALSYPADQCLGYKRFHSLWKETMRNVSQQRVSNC